VGDEYVADDEGLGGAVEGEKNYKLRVGSTAYVRRFLAHNLLERCPETRRVHVEGPDRRQTRQ
jgi:hypothetical protein